MNFSTKTAMAIFSAVLMLGCAILPLATCDTDGFVINDSETVSSEDNSVFDFMKTAEVILPSLKERTSIFLPVDGTDVSPTPLDNSVIGTKYVEAGNVVTLEGDYQFQAGEDGSDGKFVIGNGATLVLFPLADISTDFKLINKNTEDGFDNVIQMESGSKLSLFGMTFEMELSDGCEYFNLFSTIASDTEGFYCSFTYNRNTAGNFTFVVYLSGLQNYLWFGDDLRFGWDNLKPDYYPITGAGNVIEASGTILPSSENTGIVLSCTMNMRAFLPKENNKIAFTCDSINVNSFSMSYVTKTSGADIKFSLSADLKFQLNWKLSKSFQIASSGLSIDTGEIDFSVEKTDKDVLIEVNSNDNIILGVENFSADLKLSDALEFKVLLKKANICFDGLDVSMNYAPHKSKYVLSHSESDVALSIDKHSFLISCNPLRSDKYNTIITVECDFEETAIVMDKLTYDYYFTKGEWRYNINQFTSMKTISKCFSQFCLIVENRLSLRTDLFTLLYPMDSVTESSALELTGGNSQLSTVIKSAGFDWLRTDFAVSHRSDEWSGYFLLEKFGMQYVDGYVGLEKMRFHSEIPITEAFSVLPDFKSSSLGAINASYVDIELDCIKIGAEVSGIAGYEMSIDLKDFSDIDEFSLSLRDDFEFSSGIEALIGVQLTCGEIEGFVANSGSEPKEFSVTGEPEICFYLDGFEELSIDSVGYSVMLGIIKGDAEFEGGSLPFGIMVGDEATFSAQDLTALSFEFGASSVIDGTVSLDTDAELPLFYDALSKSIKIGEDYALTPKTNGYVITLDLSTKKGGTIVANDGCTLPDVFEDEEEGFKMTSDGEKGDFTLSNDTGANVSVTCEKKFYELTFDGIGMPKEYEFGTAVTIPSEATEKEGKEFFGWSDGTNMYYPGDTFVMPKHDVVMKPVYCSKVTPEFVTEGNDIILVVYVPNAEMVKVNTAGTWDIMRVTLGNTTFELSYRSFNSMFPVEKGKMTCDALYFQSIQVGSRNGPDSGKACGVNMYYSQYDWLMQKEVIKEFHKSVPYTGITTTVHIDAPSNVKGFNVYLVDSDGKLCPIDGVKYTKCDDGKYDVTFNTSSCAQFVIKPVYNDPSDNTVILVVAIVLLVLLLAGTFFLVRKSKQ